MDYMGRALSIARLAQGKTSPNPAVGAIIVKEGIVVGEGHTQPPGSWHAEIMALRQAGERARGANLYVTLEPCCHFGRTPPCTKAIIAVGIAEVHMAMLDPNPLVAGKGQAELESAGIRTFVGEGEVEARVLNEAYVKYITTGIPFVVAKFAASLDGKIATRLGDSRWITSERSREQAHRLRGISDAIIVGVNTVLADSPRLTARGEGQPEARQPWRVVVDSRGRTPPSAPIFQVPGKSLIATTSLIDTHREEQLKAVGAEMVKLPAKNGQVDLRELLRELGRREITSVLVEGGGELLGSLFDEGLVDKVCAFIVPIIIGGKGAVTAVAGQGAGKISEALRLSRVKVERFDDDILITGYTQGVE